jgi:hypothetical protein
MGDEKRMSLGYDAAGMRAAYHSAPRTLRAFPEATKAIPKTSVQGGGGLRKRWKEQNGTIYEWDYAHGTVEKYDARGHHQGEFDPDSGKQLKPASPSRRVEP